MAIKRKSQTQYSSWKTGTGISGKRRRRGGKQWRRKKATLAQKVTRLARDLKPETKVTQFYNNAGVDAKDILGLFYKTTTVNYYVSMYPLIAVAEGDDQSQRSGRKIRLQAVTIKYFIAQQLNNKVASKVMWYTFQAKTYQYSNYGTGPTITVNFWI